MVTLRVPIVSLVLLSAVASLRADGQRPISFNRDIRPILSDRCYLCHGPDEGTREADLRLDLRGDSALAALAPGHAEMSEVVKRIFSTDPDEVMPPPESHKSLTPAERDTIRRWIDEGAKYETHWAYQPLERPAVPAVGESHPVDAFIVAKLRAKGADLSPEASPERLLRRLSLDLTGLPPTEAERAAFLADRAPGAYERQVDRLLASPRFGERMAVWWLDVARFADTVGFHGDQNQRIFPYRDYVIDAFNANKPFDRFTTEQLAGDLLPDATPEQRVATGYNRLNMMTREGGAQPKEYLAKYGAERVRSVSTAWLGSTFGCAECHDHKFDPIPARDFYELQAFFADVKQWGVYHDYGYTPNPELKGFSNDHPFPPELLVESPYLQTRDREARAALLAYVDGFLRRRRANRRSRRGGRRRRRGWRATRTAGPIRSFRRPDGSSPGRSTNLRWSGRRTAPCSSAGRRSRASTSGWSSSPPRDASPRSACAWKACRTPCRRRRGAFASWRSSTPRASGRRAPRCTSRRRTIGVRATATATNSTASPMDGACRRPTPASRWSPCGC